MHYKELRKITSWLCVGLIIICVANVVFSVRDFNEDRKSKTYHSTLEDSLRAEIAAKDSAISVLKDSVRVEFVTIQKTRTIYKERVAHTLATPDSLQERLFLSNYPDTTSPDANRAVLSNPLPIPSIRSANVAFVELEAAKVENSHLWSVTEKQGDEIEILEKKSGDYEKLSSEISAQRDSCAFDNDALTEEVFEQDMTIRKQRKIIGGGAIGVALYVLISIIF